MTRDWARLGDMLRSARVAQGLEQQDVAKEIGVKRGALNNIEHGRIARVTPTVTAYARIVGWTDNSPRLVLDGRDPVERDADPAQAAPEPVAARGPAPDALAGFSLDVQQALREGPLLQSRVEEVATPSGIVRATIVIRGEDGAAPEDLLAVLRSLKIDVSTVD